ncbi:MAG: DUF3149 domain-containing protein [Betaproteobacteria bacterium]
MAWELLFGSDLGLMSLATIVLVIVIAVVYMRYFLAKMEQDDRNSA